MKVRGGSWEGVGRPSEESQGRGLQETGSGIKGNPHCWSTCLEGTGGLGGSRLK